MKNCIYCNSFFSGKGNLCPLCKEHSRKKGNFTWNGQCYLRTEVTEEQKAEEKRAREELFDN